ncbi:hypothetical protein [Lentzea sp. CC55]|uniref:hypothetical protein n=1 Tax=Lentzea sp. CC55 TaxID=2884909 RepID=UPI001F34FD87|nr:hypothetical protein [Lentzea sp. CC55]MCG8924238.1 hypothetical protein [Lentzea sp. CC55]
MTRFLRSEQTMAFPHGRLIASRDGVNYVLAPDGWDHLAGPHPRRAIPVSREDAEDWCEREGWDLHLLDEVPATTS